MKLTAGVSVVLSLLINITHVGGVAAQTTMNESDFEGTLVLEKLAEIDKVDEFLEAIDSDDLDKAKSLMKRAGVDRDTIKIVLKKMNAADGEH